jgi:hypothetical protein
MSHITSYCRITPGFCSLNGETVFQSSDTAPDVFLKDIYQQQDFQYPKFHKMDRLSKLAFCASEMLIRNNPQLAAYADDAVAMLFANRNSSGETDERFEHTYKVDAMPGPALFVYTLPNILIGEIAIRNKWYGENLFVIQPAFDAVFFAEYCNILLAQSSDACLCGWVNIGETTEAFVFLVEKESAGIELTKENLHQLYLK